MSEQELEKKVEAIVEKYLPGINPHPGLKYQRNKMKEEILALFKDEKTL